MFAVAEGTWSRMSFLFRQMLFARAADAHGVGACVGIWHVLSVWTSIRYHFEIGRLRLSVLPEPALVSGDPNHPKPQRQPWTKGNPLLCRFAHHERIQQTCQRRDQQDVRQQCQAQPSSTGGKKLCITQTQSVDSGFLVVNCSNRPEEHVGGDPASDRHPNLWSSSCCRKHHAGRYQGQCKHIRQTQAVQVDPDKPNQANCQDDSRKKLQQVWLRTRSKKVHLWLKLLQVLPRD